MIHGLLFGIGYTALLARGCRKVWRSGLFFYQNPQRSVDWADKERALANSEAVEPQSSRKKLLFNIVLGLAMSGLFVWLAARGVEWSRFKAELNTLNPLYLVLYFLVLSASHGLRLWRWGLTIRAMAPVPWGRICAVGAVGMMAIFALPARLGELARPLLIREGGQVSFAQATATVVVERILDGLTMSVVLLVTVLFIDRGRIPDEFLWSGYATAALFGGMSVGLVGSALTFRWIRRPLEVVVGRISPRLASRLVAMIGGFFEALKLLSRPKIGLMYMGATLLVWAISVFGIAILFQAQPGSTGELPIIASFVTLSVLVVGLLIPAGPGTIGVFHWAVVLALGMFAVEQSAALLFATVLHLLIAVVNCFWGVVGMIAGKISWTALWKRPA